jgi:hypothetical protein
MSDGEIMTQIAERAAPVVYELLRARGDLPAWAEPWGECDPDFQATWIAEEQDIVGPALEAIRESDWLAARIREAKVEALEEYAREGERDMFGAGYERPEADALNIAPRWHDIDRARAAAAEYRSGTTTEGNRDE